MGLPTWQLASRTRVQAKKVQRASRTEGSVFCNLIPGVPPLPIRMLEVSVKIQLTIKLRRKKRI